MFNTEIIIWTKNVWDLKVMLYTKYERYGPRSYEQEAFWKLPIKRIISDTVT